MSENLPTSLDSVPTLDIAPLQVKMKDLLTTYRNKLDRQWPPPQFPDPPGGQHVLQRMVAVTENTFKTAAFLCADTEDNPARKVEFGLSVSPLARSILDTVYALVYLFDDFTANVPRYHRAGWWELSEQYDRLQDTYGSDATWNVYLTDRRSMLDESRQFFGITDRKTKLDTWPRPSQMLKDKGLASERRDFLAYLYDWFYRDLSQDDHLSWPGLARRSSALVGEAANRVGILKQHRSKAVMTVFTMTLAVLSEIEGAVHYGDDQRLVFAWTLLGKYSADTQEVYERRYRVLLNSHT